MMTHISIPEETDDYKFRKECLCGCKRRYVSMYKDTGLYGSDFHNWCSECKAIYNGIQPDLKKKLK